jgi:uncharacterized membrane protein YjdF
MVADKKLKRLILTGVSLFLLLITVTSLVTSAQRVTFVSTLIPVIIVWAGFFGAVLAGHFIYPHRAEIIEYFRLIQKSGDHRHMDKAPAPGALSVEEKTKFADIIKHF